MTNKKVVIFGGGTLAHVRSHMALCAPAYGNTAKNLLELCQLEMPEMDHEIILTKMANLGSTIVTNDDVSEAVDKVIADPSTKIIFFSCAMCDFVGRIDGVEPGKYADRLQSSDSANKTIELAVAPKVINKIRADKGSRKDIFLVGFKTTCGLSEDEQYIAGLGLMKKSSCNLVFVNDVKTRLNMVITPEEARYHVTVDRNEALHGLVEMAKLRSHLTFTRSTVVAGEPVPWEAPEVPSVLRKVVDHCIARGAYKPFAGATVGHFAAKIGPTTFLTSRRKTNFNDLSKLGLVKVETDGPDTVIAYGSKPSVGGQSQRIVFEEHPDCDLIVHFHCPIKPGSKIPTVSQREYECGSHACGRNTSRGLAKFGNLYAVYLDQHGPNIVFNSSIDPDEVISFIEENFDLTQKTGGPVSLSKKDILESPSGFEKYTNEVVKNPKYLNVNKPYVYINK